MFFSDPVQALIGINVILTLSLLFPFLAGVWSLGLPGFMAVGAYVASWASTELGTPIPAALLLGLLASVIVSIPFGLLTMRIRGIYLAIATLAAAELIMLFFSHYQPLGGVMGYAGIPYIDGYWLLMVAVIMFLVSLYIYLSYLGKAFYAVGCDPTVASCNGLNVPMLQMLALAIGAGLAGLAGGLFGHYYSFISPANFQFSRTIDILLFLVAGGITPLGTLVGSVTLTLIPQFSTALETWAPALYALIVIIIMAITPGGVFPKNRITYLLRYRPIKKHATD
ncbi:MAG: branched-chain amino acid ABC transporter permease [Burkholderiaceae bacterium]|nr:branched-chain amino acid ABC transporter permease [Burkholderiaceae bacterium]